VVSINCDSYVILVALLSKVLKSASDLWEPVYYYSFGTFENERMNRWISSEILRPGGML
jgi:hypothetical protein